MKKRAIEINITEVTYEELSEKNIILLEEAFAIAKRSYAPYSKFHVGAAALLENGEVICGSNQENAAYPSGICAERTALFYANAKYPDSFIDTLAIAAYADGKLLENPITPCGACRQVMLETEKRFNHPIRLILFGTKKTFIIEKSSDLLPLTFTSDSLTQ